MNSNVKSGNIWRFKEYLPHVLAWTIYVAYEVLYLYAIKGSIQNPLSYVVNYTLNISLFYFHAYVFLPYFTEKLSWRWYYIFLVTFIEILIYIALKYPANLLVFGMDIRLKTYEDYYTYAIGNGLRSFYYVGFSTAFYLAVLNLSRYKKIAELEQQKLMHQNEAISLQKDLLQSKNAYLQAQVNPHLLFNTLNFMYNASARVSEKLADAVMTLSDIMRYALTTIDSDDKVPLSKEVEHIHNYIRLNQIRYEEQLQITFTQTGDIEGHRIIPLALITLVENVFKYGDLLDPGMPAALHLKIEKSQLTFTLFNKKRANRRTHGHGTGIANLKERLIIYYQGVHILEVTETDGNYASIISLSLD